MNHQYQTPFYQQQGYQTMNHSMALPQPIKLYNGKVNNNLLSTSPSPSNDLYCHQNNLSMLSKQQQYYQQPTFIQNNQKSCETITPIYNQRYQHQPWKLGRTSNELMFSNEMIVPSSSSPSPPPYNYNNESNGLSMDSTSLLLSNNNYSPPPLSVSSSSSTCYNYGNNIQGSNNYNGLLYLSDSHHHYRRSSINTSRSSSPSTSSYSTSPYQESVSRSTRSPSPAAANKRYACRLCNKRFTRPSSLTTHIYSHTGEKPFKCPVNGCGRHFSVVSNLRRHAKVHGNVSLKSSTSSSTAHSI